MSLFTE